MPVCLHRVVLCGVFGWGRSTRLKSLRGVYVWIDRNIFDEGSEMLLSSPPCCWPSFIWCFGTVSTADSMLMRSVVARSAQQRGLSVCGSLFSLSLRPVQAVCTPSRHVATSASQGATSSTTHTSSPPAGHPSSTPPPQSPQFHAESLLNEAHSLLVSPLGVGYLFRALSADAKRWLGNEGISLEQFLLRHTKHFAVFQEPGERTIMVSRSSHIPPHAIRGSEATGDELFAGAKGRSTEVTHVLNVLKYVPNDWSAFVDLGVPESIRVNVMSRKAKAYFEKYPQYFEVKAQGLNQHTFFVRRSLTLQKQVEKNGGAPTTNA